MPLGYRLVIRRFYCQNFTKSGNKIDARKQSWGTEHFPLAEVQYTKNQQTSSPKFILTIKENTDASHELIEI